MAAAAKLSLGLRKPHLWILNPKIWKFDGYVGDGSGGSLGGERGGDCGRNLCL
jgi:hypothetical protein